MRPKAVLIVHYDFPGTSDGHQPPDFSGRGAAGLPEGSPQGHGEARPWALSNDLALSNYRHRLGSLVSYTDVRVRESRSLAITP